MKLKHYLVALSLFIISPGVFASHDDPTDNARYGYIENKGQIHDQNGNARNDIYFMYYDDEFKLTLRNNGFSYEIVRTEYTPAFNTESGTPKDFEDDNKMEYNWNYTVNRVDVDFVKPNSGIEIISEGKSPFYRNYFNQYTGHEGIKRVHSYFKVIYKNIYDGIDLAFYSIEKNGKVYPEYEFIVHPHGKMSDIALNYKGDFNFGSTQDGSLLINNSLGSIHETQPIIFFSTEREPVHGKFIRSGSVVTFKSVKRSTDETMIIDPTIQWSTYWGGSQRDLTDEIATDLDNNVYVTGRTRSSSSISTAGAYQTSNAGGLDMPLMKWDLAGDLIYSTYYGGTKNEIAFCITVDPFNNPWIAGHTFSTSGIATPGAMQTVFGGGDEDDFDGNLSKFSSDGDLIYGTYFGGVGQDEFQNIWSDEDGNIYGNGLAEASTGIVYSTCWDCGTDPEGEDVVMKFDNDGTQLWVNLLGGDGRDRGHGITTDAKYVYALSTVESETGIALGNPGGNAFTTTFQGISDISIQRYNKITGEPQWISYFGGPGGERARDVRCDLNGNIYLIGQTETETGLATPGAWKESFVYNDGENRDAIVAMFDSNCNKLYATYFGSSKIEMPRSLRIYPEGAPIYIGGYTKSDTGFVTSDAFDTKNKKNNDAFWARFNWDLSELQYCTYFGGKKSESITEPGWYGPTMDIDHAGNVFLSSGTDSEEGIAYGDSYKDSLFAPGQEDFFIAKFNDPCPDGFEPNNDFNVATNLYFRGGNQIVHYAPLQKKGDKDYYTFTTTSGQGNLKIELTDLAYEADLYLYDNLDLLAGKSKLTGTQNETVIENNTYIGTYSVLIKSPTKQFAEGVCYTLTISASSTPFRLETEMAKSANGIVSIYPNPASQTSTLEFFCEQTGDYQIEICNLDGKVVVPINKTLNAGDQSIILPVDQLQSGNYIVRVIGEGMNDVVKLTIQK